MKTNILHNMKTIKRTHFWAEDTVYRTQTCDRCHQDLNIGMITI